MFVAPVRFLHVSTIELLPWLIADECIAAAAAAAGVYQHNKRPAGPQIHTMVQRQPAAPPSSSTAPVFPPAKTKGSKSKSKQDKASKSSSAEKAAAAAAAAAPDAAAAAGSDGSSQAAGNSPTSSSSAAAALNPLSEVGAGALVPGFELPAGAPGAPQPSPLDAGFSSSMPAPWLGGVGQLDLPQMQLPEPLSQPPELPSIQVGCLGCVGCLVLGGTYEARPF